MKINLNFTKQGQIAIENFNNEELIEIFTRYLKTVTKKFDADSSVPIEMNQNITAEGSLKVMLKNVNCDVDTMFKELARDIKIPLKKRLDGKLDNVFKTEVIK